MKNLLDEELGPDTDVKGSNVEEDLFRDATYFVVFPKYEEKRIRLS